MFFGELKDAWKVQAILCAKEKPVIYPAFAPNFKVEITRNGNHKIKNTNDATDLMEVMICEIDGRPDKLKLLNYVKTRERSKFRIIETDFTHRLLHGERY